MNPGVLAGVLGCAFGVLGIFTLGIVFVPLAALCSVIGLLRGLSGRSGAGIGVSLLGGFLTVMGFIFSPSLWLVTSGLFVASQSNGLTAAQADKEEFTWVKVHAGLDSTSYADLGTIQSIGDGIVMWGMQDFETPQTINGNSYSSTEGEFEYNCEGAQFRVVHSLFYSGHMGTGAIVSSDYNSTPWAAAPPGTHSEDMLKIACNDDNRK